MAAMALGAQQAAVAEPGEVSAGGRGGDSGLARQHARRERPPVGEGHRDAGPRGLAEQPGDGGDVGVPVHHDDASAATVRAGPKRPRRHSTTMLALLAVSLGYLLVILDATAVNVALAPIGADLGGDARTLHWVLDAYTLVFAAFLLSAGSGGDRIGARRLFEAGLVLFAAASAACGAAPTAATLVAARAVQGLGAALLVPCSLALVRAAFPGDRERARALGAWGAVGGIGAAAGPLFGGAVASAVGWRAVFLVNLPLAALALLLTRRHVPAPPRRPGLALDPARSAARDRRRRGAGGGADRAAATGGAGRAHGRRRLRRVGVAHARADAAAVAACGGGRWRAAARSGC